MSEFISDRLWVGGNLSKKVTSIFGVCIYYAFGFGFGSTGSTRLFLQETASGGWNRWISKLATENIHHENRWLSHWKPVKIHNGISILWMIVLFSREKHGGLSVVFRRVFQERPLFMVDLSWFIHLEMSFNHSDLHKLEMNPSSPQKHGQISKSDSKWTKSWNPCRIQKWMLLIQRAVRAAQTFQDFLRVGDEAKLLGLQETKWIHCHSIP